MSAARRFGSPTDGRSDMQTKLRYVAWWVLAAMAVLLGSGCDLAAPEIQGYAIVFGASDYLYVPPPDRKSLDLLGVAQDAAEMAELFSDQDWHVDLFLDELASKEQLRESILAIPANIRQNQLVLFYYAGHGLNDSMGQINGYPEQYLVPVPGVGVSGNYIISEFISPIDIYDLLAEYDVRHPIIILDSCHSGGFLGESGVFDGIQDDYNPWLKEEVSEYEAFDQFYSLAVNSVFTRVSYIQSEKAIVIVAAGAPELSYESSSAPYNGHGIFTWHLLQAAGNPKADSNTDGYLSTSEIYAYVRTQLDINWNSKLERSTYMTYMPRLSGSHRDYLLFKLP